MKTCNKCKVNKSTLEFGKQNNSPDGMKYSCKACCDISSKAYYNKIRNGHLANLPEIPESKRCPRCDKMKSGVSFHRNLSKVDGRDNWCRSCASKKLKKYKYGISFETYDNLFESQNGKCFICECSGEELCVDHDHKTGVIRGLLCHHCNTGLGRFNDSIDRLTLAIDYLKRFC